MSIAANDLEEMQLNNNNKGIISMGMPLHVCKLQFYSFHIDAINSDSKITDNMISSPIKDNCTMQQPQPSLLQSQYQDNATPLLPRTPCDYAKQYAIKHESIMQAYVDNPLSHVANDNDDAQGGAIHLFKDIFTIKMMIAMQIIRMTIAIAIIMCRLLHHPVIQIHGCMMILWIN